MTVGELLIAIVILWPATCFVAYWQGHKRGHAIACRHLSSARETLRRLGFPEATEAQQEATFRANLGMEEDDRG
jgi:hypothetical protein